MSKAWEAIKIAGWGAMTALLVVNTWLTHQRIESQRELNGNVIAFKAVMEKFASN